MKNKTYLIWGVVIIVIVLVGILISLSKVNKVSGTEYSFSLGKGAVLVSQGGAVVQEIPLSEDALLGAQIIDNTSSLFISGQDVNFDGHGDIAVLTGVGYGGVNYFYDYYVYDISTQSFKKDAVLVGIGNPQFDSERQEIVSSYRSGPRWYTQTFVYKDGVYKALGEVEQKIPGNE